MLTKEEFHKRINWTLTRKILESSKRIIEWYEAWEGNVYISFSGGKDSTVLLHLARRIYPNITGVFVNTGLEYPEILSFVKTIDNVEWLRPKIPFHKIIDKYGYPVISKENAQKIDEIRNTKSKKLKYKRLYGKYGRLPNKWKYLINTNIKISHRCCYFLKKSPLKRFENINHSIPMIGNLATESKLRKFTYLKNGCNLYDSKSPKSAPLSFWTEKDIWDYIKEYNINYSKIYNMGEKRTGCMFCMFGTHLEKYPNKFQRMQLSHPKQWGYCIYKLNCKQVLEKINVPYKYNQRYLIKIRR